MNETWKSLKGIVECGDYYEVSDFGNVRSITRICSAGRTKKGRILKQSKNKKGYMTVKFSLNGKEKSYIVHRLVAIAFIPNPENKPQVNHIDNIRDNNRLNNLEWCTNSENQQHCVAQGRDKRQLGEDRPASKLKENDVLEIRALWTTGKYKQRDLAEMYSVGQRTITTIVNRITWKHI